MLRRRLRLAASVTLPLLTLASGSPVAIDENGHMEYEAAGAWRGAQIGLDDRAARRHWYFLS